MAPPWPSYLALHESGELAGRAAQAWELLEPCTACPRECGAARLSGAAGFCGGAELTVVSSAGPHFGEERPLVGTGGSGTIFLAGCNLGCIFCQNYEISHLRQGVEVGADELANTMVRLQARGCHNINFVTPTHYVPQILAALVIAVAAGLRVPLVYNSGGYDAVPTLRLLDGVFDIYMPDAKYAEGEVAARLSGAGDYPEVMRAALTEMHRQVGDLEIGPDGLARRGLLVRHLVLPDGLAGTPEVMRFLASLSRDTWVNVMAQYRPCGQALQDDMVNRALAMEEFQNALGAARSAGLHRLDQ